MVRKLSNLLKASCVSAVVLAAIGAAPSSAFAGRFDDHRDNNWRRDEHNDRDHHSNSGGFVGISIGGGSVAPCPPPAPLCEVPQRIWIAPVYRTVCDQRWVEPVYRTVCDRVWIEPVTRTDYERAWIPDRYEWRDVDQYANGKHYTAHQYVLVEAAHWGDVPHVTVITPGHYEDRPRQELVSAAHFENVEHQELVSPGHWEVIGRPATVIVERPAPPRYEESHARIDLRFPL